MDYNCEGKSKIAELLLNCEGKHYVVFFEKELIGISLEKSYIREKNKELKNKLKAEGVGFLDRLGTSTEYWDAFSERFLYMSEVEIVAEFKKAVAIKYIDIKKYWLTPFIKDGAISDGDTEDKIGYIEIKSKDKGSKMSFEHKYAVETSEYKQLINYFEKSAVNADGHIKK